MCACSSIQQRASKTRCLKDRNHLAYRFLCLSSRVRNQFLEEEKNHDKYSIVNSNPNK